MNRRKFVGFMGVAVATLVTAEASACCFFKGRRRRRGVIKSSHATEQLTQAPASSADDSAGCATPSSNVVVKERVRVSVRRRMFFRGRRCANGFCR